jgi:hypothetical protein
MLEEHNLMRIKLSILLFLSLALTVSPVIAGDPQDSWEEELRAEMEKHQKEREIERDKKFSLQELIGGREEHEKHMAEIENNKKEFEKDKRLAEQGNADAQVRIGRVYEYGSIYMTLDTDYKEAIRWYKLAAEQGNAAGQYSLGYAYQHGHEVLQDYKEAIRWYKLAAEQDYSPAQYGLGKINEVLQEYTTSHKWYNIAGANGFERALKSRDIVEEEMTPTQIIEAQRLAKEWVEKHQKR